MSEPRHPSEPTIIGMNICALAACCHDGQQSGREKDDGEVRERPSKH
jgi:hypothetical protein